MIKRRRKLTTLPRQAPIQIEEMCGTLRDHGLTGIGTAPRVGAWRGAVQQGRQGGHGPAAQEACHFSRPAHVRLPSPEKRRQTGSIGGGSWMTQITSEGKKKKRLRRSSSGSSGKPRGGKDSGQTLPLQERATTAATAKGRLGNRNPTFGVGSICKGAGLTAGPQKPKPGAQAREQLCGLM